MARSQGLAAAVAADLVAACLFQHEQRRARKEKERKSRDDGALKNSEPGPYPGSIRFHRPLRGTRQFASTCASLMTPPQTSVSFLMKAAASAGEPPAACRLIFAK